MEWVWITGAAFSAWALLRVIGAERQRRLHEVVLRVEAEREFASSPRPPARAKPAISTPKPPAPVGSKAAR